MTFTEFFRVSTFDCSCHDWRNFSRFSFVLSANEDGANLKARLSLRSSDRSAFDDAALRPRSSHISGSGLLFAPIPSFYSSHGESQHATV